MDYKFIKKLTEIGEDEYANTPSSGKNSGIYISREDIINNLKPISIRKPVIMIVGSVATQGESYNDIDILVRGDDLNENIQEAINFRLYRMFTDILGCEYNEVSKYVHIHYNNFGSYTSYIPIYELTLKPINNPEIVNMNSVPIHIKGDLDVIKSKRRIIAGYASVIEIDKDNQLIPKEALESGIQTLLNDPNYSNLMLTHNNIQVGKILDEYGDLTTHVDDNGLFIVAELRQDLKSSDLVWQSILNGELNSFSIAGEVILDHKECDDNKCYTVIDKINIFEVSVCRNPVNNKSGFLVVNSNVSDNEFNVCSMFEDNKDSNMTKEKIVEEQEESVKVEEKEVPENEVINTETQVEEKEEEVKKEEEINLKEVIDHLNREIEALKGIINEMKNPPEETDEEDMEEEEKKSEDINTKESGGLVDTIKEKLSDIIKEAEGDIKIKLQELLKMVNNLKGKYPLPSKYPYPKDGEPSKYPYPEQKEEIDSLKKTIDELKSSIPTTKEIEELKLSISNKDKIIKELTSRIEHLESQEQEPKALAEPIVEEEEENIALDPSLVRDKIRPGVIYRDVY